MLCICMVQGYILVAMPQSSSSSTMESLGVMSCLHAESSISSRRACQKQSLSQINPIWKVLADEHSHICQLPAALLRSYSLNQSTIFKDHVLPTQPSIRALLAARRPVLVLLRKPIASLHGWCERRLREGWQLSNIIERAAARFAALVVFDSTWRQTVARHAGQFLLVEYEHMQSQGREAAMGAMLAIWKVPACRSFSDSTAHLVNETSTAECSRVVNRVVAPTPSTTALDAVQARTTAQDGDGRDGSDGDSGGDGGEGSGAQRSNVTTERDRCDPRARRILLVGNGPSVLNNLLGWAIDSFPHVVRFNEYQISYGFESHVGREIQRWVVGSAFAAELIAAYPERTAPVLVALPHRRGNCSYVYMRLAAEAQLTHSQRERVAFVSDATARSLSQRLDAVPSSGLTVLWHFLQTFPLVHIHGFDFFANSRAGVHYFDDGLRRSPHSESQERSIVNELISAGRVQLLSSCYNETARPQSSMTPRQAIVSQSRITDRRPLHCTRATPSHTKQRGTALAHHVAHHETRPPSLQMRRRRSRTTSQDQI